MRTIAEVHRSNIARLIEQEAASPQGPRGAQTRIAEKIGKSPKQVSQWLRDPSSDAYRGIGPKVARQIEEAMGLPAGWLDVDHGPVSSRGAESSAPDGDHTQWVANGTGIVAVPHAAGFDNEPGPANLIFPQAMLRDLMEVYHARRLGWIVNPTDSMGEVIPRGMFVFVDTGVQSVRGNGIYAVRLFGSPSIMRVQVRGEDSLRVMGSNRFDDAIDLFGEQVNSLEVGGLVVGYADRIKLI